jgi:hypothetical protein
LDKTIQSDQKVDTSAHTKLAAKQSADQTSDVNAHKALVKSQDDD